MPKTRATICCRCSGGSRSESVGSREAGVGKRGSGGRKMSDDDCCPGGTCTPRVDRRDFVRLVGLGLTGVAAPTNASVASGVARPDQLAEAIHARAAEDAQLTGDLAWPSLRVYDRGHLARIALPLGGIGTGTVSLGGRGDLRDWEIVNRPAKGFSPQHSFFALQVQRPDGSTVARALEGTLRPPYEGSHGSTVPNHNLPRFRDCSFAS